MHRSFPVPPARRLTPWIVAAVVLLTSGEAAFAQDAIMASAGVATEGAGPLGLGALVGAFVAGAAALRDRFKRR